jgi:hypothetical protein
VHEHLQKQATIAALKLDWRVWQYLSQFLAVHVTRWFELGAEIQKSKPSPSGGFIRNQTFALSQFKGAGCVHTFCKQTNLQSIQSKCLMCTVLHIRHLPRLSFGWSVSSTSNPFVHHALSTPDLVYSGFKSQPAYPYVEGLISFFQWQLPGEVNSSCNSEAGILSEL